MHVHDGLVDTKISAPRPGPRRVTAPVNPARRCLTARHGVIGGDHSPNTPADHSPGPAPELAGR